MLSDVVVLLSLCGVFFAGGGLAGNSRRTMDLLEQREGEQRIGGAADLPERVVAALLACHDATGAAPTAKRYHEWRQALPRRDRDRAPSLTAVVPIAYPSWGEARAAAGVDSADVRNASHGPTPKWTREQCLGMVAEWLEAGGSGTLAAFTEWTDKQRTEGRNVPSVSTVRLRLRMPWQTIRDEAENHRSAEVTG